MSRFLKIASLLMVLPLLQAQSAEYVYAPEGCDFEMTFPEEPITSRRCNPDPDEPNRCYEIRTFNRVFAMDSAIKVTARCTQAEDNMLERYSGPVMEFTLKSMATENGITDIETGYADHSDSREATLLGRRAMEGGT